MQVGLNTTNLDAGSLRLTTELEALQRSLASAGDADAARLDAEAEEAGRRLEALFATMLVKELRRSLPDEGFFTAGPGADTYNAWFDEHLGDALAASGALELAGMVKAAMGSGRDRA